MTRAWTPIGLAVGFGLLFLANLGMPDDLSWIRFILLLALAKGLVVLGLMVLWRTGLVSFGHGLYYGLGAYAACLFARHTGVTDAIVLIVVGVAMSGVVALVLGLLVARYREIFFAMLNVAFSMVLWGILAKTEALGSTDGFGVPVPSFFGFTPDDVDAKNIWLLSYLVVVCFLAAVAVNRYLDSTLGRLTTAIRDNEIRVEYLGFSVFRAIYTKYVMSALLAGAGGAFAAMAIGQVDPDSFVYWLVSGEFVFVTVLSGPGHVAAPFIGSFVFEILRVFASEYTPETWQAIVGGVLLVIIFALPMGLWSLIEKLYRRPGGAL